MTWKDVMRYLEHSFSQVCLPLRKNRRRHHDSEDSLPSYSGSGSPHPHGRSHHRSPTGRSVAFEKMEMPQTTTKPSRHRRKPWPPVAPPVVEQNCVLVELYVEHGTHIAWLFRILSQVFIIFNGPMGNIDNWLEYSCCAQDDITPKDETIQRHYHTIFV
ncbi:hypothetical protein L1887_39020 [Cichorium endivia]|nr:hypothetical protein L1887_39020 [Cichorium endivia]